MLNNQYYTAAAQICNYLMSFNEYYCDVFYFNLCLQQKSLWNGGIDNRMYVLMYNSRMRISIYIHKSLIVRHHACLQRLTKNTVSLLIGRESWRLTAA